MGGVLNGMSFNVFSESMAIWTIQGEFDVIFFLQLFCKHLYEK